MWLDLPVVEDAVEEGVNDEIGIMPPCERKQTIIGRLMNEKMRGCGSTAAPERRMIRLEAQTVEVLLLQNGKDIADRVVTQRQLSPRLCPSVAIDVSSIWSD